VSSRKRGVSYNAVILIILPILDLAILRILLYRFAIGESLGAPRSRGRWIFTKIADIGAGLDENSVQN